jgi:sporulation protein YlmC with PRC-barrel domain
MNQIMVKSLSGKTVVSIDGAKIGTLHNITVNQKSGDLLDIIVKADPTYTSSRYKQEGNYVIVPFSDVKNVGDFIILETKP